MLFSSRFSTKTLVSLCQSFRISLSAGLPLVDVCRQQARKGPLESRAVIERIAQRLQAGEGLDDVLKDERKYFPPLFLGMTSVGEQTGNLAEVFRELENYYRNMLTLRRQFQTEIFWPVFQFVFAIGVITLLILILGWLPNAGTKDEWDPLGLGVGVPGALRFLGGMAVAILGGWALYILATRGLGQKAAVHRILLRLPALGPCLEALCLSRFCMGLHLTMDTSLSMPKALRLSLKATGNGAYEECADTVASSVKRGGEVSKALAKCRGFPEEFVNIVANGEESGQLPESMGHQAEAYQEIAGVRMKILTRLASFAVWGFVALLLIFVIGRLLMSVAGVYQQAFKDAGV